MLFKCPMWLALAAVTLSKCALLLHSRNGLLLVAGSAAICCCMAGVMAGVTLVTLTS